MEGQNPTVSKINYQRLKELPGNTIVNLEDITNNSPKLRLTLKAVPRRIGGEYIPE